MLLETWAVGVGRGLLSYYDVLRIASDADARAVRRAYLALMRQYHPDNCRVNTDYGHYHSARINEAYRILGDPIRRADYDSALARLHYNKLHLLVVVAFERSRQAAGGMGRATRRAARALLLRLRGALFGADRRAAYGRAVAGAVRMSRELIVGSADALVASYAAARSKAIIATRRLGNEVPLARARMASELVSAALILKSYWRHRPRAGLPAGRALAEARSAGRPLLVRASSATVGMLPALRKRMPEPARLSAARAPLIVAPLLAAAFVLAISQPTGTGDTPVQAPPVASTPVVAATSPELATAADTAVTLPSRFGAGESITAPPPPLASQLDRPRLAMASADRAGGSSPELESSQPPTAATTHAAIAPRTAIAAPSRPDPAQNEIATRRSPSPAEAPARSREPAVAPQRACFDAIVSGPEAYRACLRAQASD